MSKQQFSYDDYLVSLPDERRAAIERVWKTVRENMPAGYAEQINPKYLMFTADGEMYISLANQKNYISLHLMPIYVFPELKAELENSGKRLKGGKSCVNFLRAEELPLDLIGRIVGSCAVETYQKAMRQMHGK